MIDLKFDIDGKKMSSKNINAKKNFESFHKKIQTKSRYLDQKRWFWMTTGISSLTLLTAIIFGNYNNNISNKSSNSILKDEKEYSNNPQLNELSFDNDLSPGVLTSISNPRKKVIENQIDCDPVEIKHKLYSKYITEKKGLLEDSTIRLKPHKTYHSLSLIENSERVCSNTEDTIRNSKFRIKQNKKITKTEKLKISISNNLVYLELSKIPQYQKISKNRIQIRH